MNKTWVGLGVRPAAAERIRERHARAEVDAKVEHRARVYAWEESVRRLAWPIVNAKLRAMVRVDAARTGSEIDDVPSVWAHEIALEDALYELSLGAVPVPPRPVNRVWGLE